MYEQLDYAEMLEIPVSTVNVVKKKSIFKRKGKAQDARPRQQAEEFAADPIGDAAAEEPREELKDMVVDSVNERVGAYVYAEDLSDPPKPEKKRAAIRFGGKGNVVLITEMVAVVVLAAAIFLTNVFLPNSVINTFIASFTADKTVEPTYSELKLSSVVSERSDAEVTVSSAGVLSFQAKGCVYPVCDGTVASVAADNGLYTVQIRHTSTFSSVITGLTSVYAEKGAAVAANIPFAYSDGANAVNVSMYDGETLLNCYTLAGEVPVWNT